MKAEPSLETSRCPHRRLLAAKKFAEDEIRALIMQRDYPCVAAVQSVVRHDYEIGIYGEFGKALQWRQLRADLLEFMKVQKATQSRYLSYWAAFDTLHNSVDEAEFETRLWLELSALSSVEDRATDWGAHESNPANPEFCLSLEGERLFVVGLHPGSSRMARRFSRPALVFNAFSQFEKFEQEGTYPALVESIRRREMKFQNSLNPMVTEHGDAWEAIQFSGRQNTADWQCPFRFSRIADKPR